MIGDILYYIVYGSCVNTTLLMGLILFLIKDKNPYSEALVAVKKNIVLIYFSITAALAITLFSPNVIRVSIYLPLFLVQIQLFLTMRLLRHLLRVDPFLKRALIGCAGLLILLVMIDMGIKELIKTEVVIAGNIIAFFTFLRMIVWIILFISVLAYMIICMNFYFKKQPEEQGSDQGLVVANAGWILPSFLIWNLIYLLIFFFYNYYVNLIFLCVTALFYFLIGLFILKYEIRYPSVEPIEDSDKNSDEEGEQCDWKVEDWIEKKGFLQPGIVIADVADEMGIPAKKLSLYIRSSFQDNFNVWLNTLRIEEAKRIMQRDVSLSVTEVSEMVGYSDRSHFSRQFRQITGETAVSYQKKFRKTSETSEN